MAKRLPGLIVWRGFRLSRNWSLDGEHPQDWRGYATLTSSGPSLGLLVRRRAGKWRACLRMPDMVEPREERGLWGAPSSESPQVALDLALEAWRTLIGRISDGSSGWDGVI